MIQKYNEFNSRYTPEEILTELSYDLLDVGLKIEYPNDHKFGNKFYMAISDDDKIFCKDYPKDDLDWLYGKKIIVDFLDEIEHFGLVRDKDYKLYGGGLGVNLVFDDKNVIKL